MDLHNVQQGSQAWLDLRANNLNASEASAMLGCSKYMTRDQLLELKHSGISETVSDHLQKLFDRGHAAEASIRPHVEKIIGEDLFPVTGTETIDGLDLGSSFDGLTMSHNINFEHKLWNEKLVASLEAGTLEKHYLVQFEQQMLLSGAEKTIFVVSDGTPDQMVYYFFEPDLEIRGEILRGWKQFVIDLAEYKPTFSQDAPVATPITALPAILYQLNGLAITSNLAEYKVAAMELVEASKVPMTTDQEFVDADLRVKAFKKAEENIAQLCDQVIGEIQDVDKFRKDLMEVSGLLRQARLNGEKLVDKRKFEIRQEYVDRGQDFVDQHVAELNGQFNRPYLQPYRPDFAGAIKGKRNLASMCGAINDLVASTKIALNDMAGRVHTNTKTLNELATDYNFLFVDLKDLIFKGPEDFRNLVKARISSHQEETAQREEAERVANEQTQAVETSAPETSSPAVEPIQGRTPDKATVDEAPQPSRIEVSTLIKDSLIANGIGVKTAAKVAGLIAAGKVEGVTVNRIPLKDRAVA